MTRTLLLLLCLAAGVGVSGKVPVVGNHRFPVPFGAGPLDPFAAYLGHVPKILETLSDSISGTGEQEITTREIVFSSKDNINRIYGILSFPRKSGKYPGLLVLHGGSGDASGLRPVVEKFARKGYVAFACDMAGYCNTGSTPHSSGPWKAHPAPDERPRFDIVGGLKNSSLMDSEVAGLEAFNLLCARQDVDKKRVGITGYSWGGYSATMLAGLLGSRVKAVYSFWGCGYYDQGSFWKKIIDGLPPAVRSQWLQYFDAGRRAENIRSSYFVEAASNDTYFWPEAVSATLQSIRAPKNHVWRPNVNHREVAASAMMQEAYLDHHLKGVGRPFPSIGIASVKQPADSSVEVEMQAVVPGGVTIRSVRLYYSLPGPDWQSRTWKPLEARLSGKGRYIVVIPPELGKRRVDFYACLTDSRGVAVSTDMY